MDGFKDFQSVAPYLANLLNTYNHTYVYIHINIHKYMYALIYIYIILYIYIYTHIIWVNCWDLELEV